MTRCATRHPILQYFIPYVDDSLRYNHSTPIRYFDILDGSIVLDRYFNAWYFDNSLCYTPSDTPIFHSIRRWLFFLHHYTPIRYSDVLEGSIVLYHDTIIQYTKISHMRRWRCTKNRTDFEKNESAARWTISSLRYKNEKKAKIKRNSSDIGLYSEVFHSSILQYYENSLYYDK